MIPSLEAIKQYAPDVAPQTIAAIIRVESGGNQFAVGVNCAGGKRVRAKSAQEAVSQARYFISKGYSVDLGLMQINSRNLPGLGLTIEQAFDPAANIEAGARILARGYRGAIKRYGPGQNALRAALSAYNTGNYEKGLKNGYVAKYFSSGLSSASMISRRHRFMVTMPRAALASVNLISDPYIVDLAVYRSEQ